MPTHKLGYRTTAVEALRGADLTGRTAVVTGGSSGGLGFETAYALALAGAHVVLTSRKLEAGQQVVDQLRASGVKGTLEAAQLDLADLASVHAFAVWLLSNHKQIDLLILNAGVMACPQGYTKDGFETQIGTNHFGHFALVQHLLPALRKQEAPSRVIVVASLACEFGHIQLDDLHWRRRPYNSFRAYGASKLANVLFAKELARRLQGTAVSAYSLHPGSIITNLSRHFWIAQFAWVRNAVAFLAYPFLKTPEQGASTTVYAATAVELANQSGAYLSDCAVAQPRNKEAHDMQLAQQLWAETERQLAAAVSKKAAAGDR